MSIKIQGELSLDGSGWSRGLNKAGKEVQHFAKDQMGELKSMIAGAFTVGALHEFSKSTIEWAKNIRSVANGMNVGYEWLQKMTDGAEKFGGTMEDVGKVLDTFNKSRGAAIQNPAGEQAAAFGRLGVSQSDIANLSPQEFFDKMVAALKDGTQANIADLEAVGGRSARALAAAFKNQFESDVPVMSEELVDKLAEVGDSFKDLEDTLRVEFAPAIIFVIDVIKGAITLIKAVGAELGAIFASIEQGNFKGALKAGSDAYFKVIQDSQDKEVAKEIRQNEERSARHARNRQAPSFGEPIYKETPVAIEQKRKIYSDSFLAVGGFLGANSASKTIEQIATKQLRALENIKLVLDEINKRFGDGQLQFPT